MRWAENGGTVENFLLTTDQLAMFERNERITFTFEFDGHSFDFSFAIPSSADFGLTAEGLSGSGTYQGDAGRRR